VVFYSTAFFIQSNFGALMAMAKFANQNNKLFAFNFAAEYIFQQSKSQLLEVIMYSDFIFCNKNEAIACGRDMQSDLGLT
jgi:sugar/nucleoside kinase (ribokinase family)